jgi:hypothetical protein
MTDGHGLGDFAGNSKGEKAIALVVLLATSYLISISSSFVSSKQVSLLGLFLPTSCHKMVYFFVSLLLKECETGSSKSRWVFTTRL